MGAGCGAKISVEVKRRPIVKSIWNWICQDKDGNFKWSVDVENVVTDEGLESILDVVFMSGTQITAWYVALIEDGSSPTSASTYAVPVYTECVDVTNATRPTFDGVQTDQQVDNIVSKAVFTMDATVDLIGGALVGGGTDADVLGDTAGGGTLYCAVEFGTPISVVATDVVSIAITITAVESAP
jgi:hypothetical protein